MKRGVKKRRKSAASRKRTGKRRWLSVRKSKRTNAAKRSRKAVSTPRPSAKLSKALRAATRSTSGMKSQRRFKKFWKTDPVSVKKFDDSAVKHLKLGGLVSMGKSDRVVLRLNGKAKTTTLRGKWEPYTDADGKRILILSGRKIQGPLKAVGVAPETWYMASPRIEAAGTHKAKVLWRHKHTDDGGRPPLVYADRNGKIDRNSNFIYARGTYTVTDWIRR